MLFDIRGKHRRLFKAIYIVLSVLIMIGLVGYGIGSSGSSIFDLFGQGGGSSIDDQVEKYQRQVKRNPKSEEALLSLARAQYSVATTGENYNQQTGQFSEEAAADLRGATDSWEKYLTLKPKKVDLGVAAQMVNAYVGLGDYTGAVKAERLIVEANPSVGTYSQLAALAYAAGNISLGDQAAEKAVKEAKPKDKKTVKKQLKKTKEQAQAIAATSTTASGTATTPQ